MKILVLNAGSSSQKSCLYDLPEDNLPTNPPEPIWEAMIDWTVLAEKGVLTVKANGIKQKIELANSDSPIRDCSNAQYFANRRNPGFKQSDRN